jgi:hypothetical protein
MGDGGQYAAWDSAAAASTIMAELRGVRISRIPTFRPEVPGSALARTSRRAGAHWIAEPGAVPGSAVCP